MYIKHSAQSPICIRRVVPTKHSVNIQVPGSSVLNAVKRTWTLFKETKPASDFCLHSGFLTENL